MNNMRKFLLLILLLGQMVPAMARSADLRQVKQEQAEEKNELSRMRDELNDLKKTIMEGGQAMGQLQSQVQQQLHVQEYKLNVKEGKVELLPGVFASALTYNGTSPGPTLTATENDIVRIVITNETRVPTSFYIDGLVLPHSVSGLPREGQGIIKPGQSQIYQFRPDQTGFFVYHPQVNNLNQMSQGLYGALIVDPQSSPHVYNKEMVLILGQWTGSTPLPAKVAPTPGKLAQIQVPSGPSTFFTVNGKCAPNIPAIEVDKGDRVRLYVTNTTTQPIPLQLGGHRFEVVAQNGSDSMEPHVYRDTYCLQPQDRVTLEFLADNPGVWSLASKLPHQVVNHGKFPGGIAIAVRYRDFN